VRLASLGALPVAGLADRFGRRAVLLASCGLGLALTVAAAASPGYWWFVAIFALGRPLLSAATSVAQVDAAEQTGVGDRAKAVALIAGGYGLGSGLTAVLHSLAGGTLGFRGIFALAIVPLALLPVVARWIGEPDRYLRASAAAEHPLPVLGAVGPAFRRRLIIVTALAFGLSVITGPANSFVFIYAQNVLRLSGVAIASMVGAAGAAGLVGLLAGRWLADHVGRRPTGAVSMVAIAGCGVLAYSGSRPGLVIGYVLGVLVASIFAPAAGALANELFPTAVRASVSGWVVAAGVLGAVGGLLAFGAIADVGNRFAIAAVFTFLPAVAFAGLFWLVPETAGREPEDLWPTAP
jgi:MFS family permease